MAERIIRYSSTETFLQSPRKYYLQYILGIEKIYDNDGYRPAFTYDIGNVGHAGLEAFYKGEDVDEGMSAKIAEMNVNPDCEEVRLGREAVARYLKWEAETQPDKGFTTVDVEERLYLDMGDILGDHVILTGEPDRVKRDRFGSLHVDDHKFTAKYTQLSTFVLYNRQGMTYGLLARGHYGEPLISFTLNQVMSKPPKTKSFTPVERAVQWQSQEMLNRHETYLRRVLTQMVKLHQEVDAGDISGAYPHPQMLCTAMCGAMAPICCGITSQEPAAVADIIRTDFRKKEA